jgi:hypothetical protein
VSATISAVPVQLTNPIIKLVGSNPDTRVSKGTVESTFEITDYTNGIFVPSIRLNTQLRGDIVSISPIIEGKKYSVVVSVSASGSVEIFAQNFIGRESSLRINNYVIRCDYGREINLVNYLPYNDRYSATEELSEFEKFTLFFEEYLNSIYESSEEGCNLSMLQKIADITKLHDIDSINVNHIPFLANMMGYEIDVNKNEIGTFGGKGDMSDEDFKAYQEKALRFVVRNLPNWYSIKTTSNSIKIMLLSFGIIGNAVEYYTLDYDKMWKLNRVEANKFVSDDMGASWFPTPHLSVGVNISETDVEIISDVNVRKQVLNAMEAIRPANVVLESIVGYTDAQLPEVSTTIKFKTTKTINVGIDKMVIV